MRLTIAEFDAEKRYQGLMYLLRTMIETVSGTIRDGEADG